MESNRESRTKVVKLKPIAIKTAFSTRRFPHRPNSDELKKPDLELNNIGQSILKCIVLLLKQPLAWSRRPSESGSQYVFSQPLSRQFLNIFFYPTVLFVENSLHVNSKKITSNHKNKIP